MEIHGRPIPELTLKMLRSGFGKETENTIYTGTPHSAPTEVFAQKGWDVYGDRARWQREGSEFGVTFYFMPQEPGGELPKAIVDADVVQALTVTDVR